MSVKQLFGCVGLFIMVPVGILLALYNVFVIRYIWGWHFTPWLGAVPPFGVTYLMWWILQRIVPNFAINMVYARVMKESDEDDEDKTPGPLSRSIVYCVFNFIAASMLLLLGYLLR